MVTAFDTRASSSNKSSELQPSFTLHAHDKAVSTISYSPSIANVCLVFLFLESFKFYQILKLILPIAFCSF